MSTDVVEVIRGFKNRRSTPHGIDVSKLRGLYFSGWGDFDNLVGLGKYAGICVDRKLDLYGDNGALTAIKEVAYDLVLVDTHEKYIPSLLIGYVLGSSMRLGNEIKPIVSIVENGNKGLVGRLAEANYGSYVCILKAERTNKDTINLGLTYL